MYLLEILECNKELLKLRNHWIDNFQIASRNKLPLFELLQIHLNIFLYRLRLAHSEDSRERY